MSGDVWLGLTKSGRVGPWFGAGSPNSRTREFGAVKVVLWIDFGFLITASADRFPSPPAQGLQEGLTTALGAAEALTVRDFLAHSGSPNDDDRCFALACVALNGTGPPARCGQTQTAKVEPQ